MRLDLWKTRPTVANDQETWVSPRKALLTIADFNRSYMGAVQRGEKNIMLAMVNKVAKALKIPLSELFRGV